VVRPGLVAGNNQQHAGQHGKPIEKQVDKDSLGDSRWKTAGKNVALRRRLIRADLENAYKTDG
jgi:hypothetical protein